MRVFISAVKIHLLFLLFLLFLFAGANSAFAACPAGKIDLLDYLLSDDGKGNFISDGEFFYGYQTTVEGKPGFIIRKSCDPRGFESFYYDDQYIYLVEDTTWNITCSGEYVAAEYFLDPGFSNPGFRRWPRCMGVGQRATLPNGYIMGKGKTSCQSCNPGIQAWSDHSLTYQGSYTFPNGVSLSDVIIIDWAGGERFFFDKNIGWVGFEASWLTGYYNGERASGQPVVTNWCGSTPSPDEFIDGCGPSTTPFCPVRGGSKVKAAPATTHSALKERVREECTGNWLERKVCDIIKRFIDFFWPESFQYRQTAGPASLQRVQQQALNSVGEAYEGIIARMLPPNYHQGTLDPKAQLAKAEGQKVEGEIISNQKDAQQRFDVGSGQYEVSEEDYKDHTDDYVLDAKFPDVPALVDKYGFIRQAFVPQAPLASLPYVNCPTSSRQIEFVEPVRDVDWDAYTEGGEASCQRDDPNDPDCREEPLPHPPASCPTPCSGVEWFDPPEEEDQEEETPNCGYCGCPSGYSARCNGAGGWECVWNPGLCGDGNCPCTGEISVYVEAPVDTQTNVSLVKEAWDNIAGGSVVDEAGNILQVGGALDIFTLPGSNFKKEVSEEAEAPFIYRSQTACGHQCESQATLPIEYMGGVAGAFSCVVDQLLAPPANAAKGICEEWMENLPGSGETGAAPTRQAVLGQSTTEVYQTGGFWATLGNLVGRALHLFLSL